MPINSIQIEGNLTKDPEMRPAGGKTVFHLSIAHNRKKKEGDNYVDLPPEFFDVEFWPNDPTYWIKRLGKGASVVVFGRIQQDRWEKDGVQHSRVKIVAESFAAKWLPEVQSSSSAPAPSRAEDVPPDDNCPF